MAESQKKKEETKTAQTARPTLNNCLIQWKTNIFQIYWTDLTKEQGLGVFTLLAHFYMF